MCVLSILYDVVTCFRFLKNRLFKNTGEYAQLFNKTGKAVMIEQCHWGQGPGFKGSSCDDYNFFRSSKDIEASYQSILDNAHSVIQWQPWSAGAAGLVTGPGCWAYPDMLMVGNLDDFTTERTHFGLWCIVSSPLVLSFDVANETTLDRVWPIISNADAIAVNQAWAGHPGSLAGAWMLNGQPNPSKNPKKHATIELWAKPVAEHSVAVLIVNNGATVVPGGSQTLSFSPQMVNFTGGGPNHTQIEVYDVWANAVVGKIAIRGANVTVAKDLAKQDSAFYRLTAV